MNIQEKVFGIIRFFLFLALFLSISGFVALVSSLVLIMIKNYLLIKNPEYIDSSTAYLIITCSLILVFALYVNFKKIILNTYNGTLQK